MECRTGLCFLFLHLCVSVFGYATVYDIDNWCDSTITVDEAVRIKLRSYSWPSQRSCQVTLSGSSIYHSDSSTRILAKFLNIGLSTGLAGGCTKSRVDIIDSDGVSILSDSTGTCGYSTPIWQPYKSTGNTMTIRLKRQSTFTLSGSFSLLATQFSTGLCDDFGEYTCFNGRCIDDDLTCDGYDNCGDDSDELDGCGLASGATAGVVVGVIFFFIFVCLVITGVYRRRTYGRIFWSANPYDRGLTTVTQTTTTASCSGATVATAQYGVQNPAPVYTTAAPPPAYPGSPYPAAGTYPH